MGAASDDGDDCESGECADAGGRLAADEIADALLLLALAALLLAVAAVLLLLGESSDSLALLLRFSYDDGGDAIVAMWIERERESKESQL